MIRNGVFKEIVKGVLRKKLSKMRHLVINEAINCQYLDKLFPAILKLFSPQKVNYNGGIANMKEWKISCYLEVMKGGVPCTNPNTDLRSVCLPLLDACDTLFLQWYKQQHACNAKIQDSSIHSRTDSNAKRIMSFVTRYTPSPGEQALLKHVDGAGKVDGSLVLALPIDRWSAPEEMNSFVGFGGGLTFWDGKNDCGELLQLNYATRSGDVAFIDR
mmetsp:Transcript_13890/g.19881  ORF Transcript_13890/g.19881 Transcript_13890/m.19881 type:complete len:216 (-) Transcript_13890:9-656(-)